MGSALTFKRCDLERAIESVQAKGLPVGAVEIDRNGTIRVLTAAPPTPVDEEEAELAAYRARANGQGRS